jgi:hypothetical protein
VLQNLELTAHVFFLQSFLSFNLIMMFGFHGDAQLISCCGEKVHMQSVGEEGNAY